MKRFKLLILYIIIIISIIINIPIKTGYAYDKPYTILILNSYNVLSKWENYISSSIYDNISTNKNIIINVEYLDARNTFDEDYQNNFNSLLSLKYDTDEIDAIIAIDDEAFMFSKDRLFDESSIFYKKPIIFSGVNSELNLTPKEQKFISGVYDIEDNITFINLLLTLHPDVENINYLLDNSIYSQIVEDSVSKLITTLPENIKLNFIKDKYLDNILNNSLLDGKSSTINIIVGDYKSIESNELLPLDKSVELLQNKSFTPIYTKSQPYIGNGCIGGVVDWGSEQGKLISDIITFLYSGNSISDIPIIVKAIEKTVFDYSILFKYNINPLKLPPNTIFINKGFFDFLLPKPLVIICWSLLIISIVLIVYFIIKYLQKKKESKKTKFLYEQMQIEENLKNEFISTISHELRTPINIIINSAKLIKVTVDNDTLNTSNLLKNLNFITLNSNRLLRLINNIIDIPKLNSGFISPNFTVVNIIELIENTVDSVVPFAKNRDIEIIFDTEVEELFTSTDIEKLDRIILNLMSNAIKFTSSGGKIFVAINIVNEDHLNLIVQDTGVGIAKNQLDNIFNKFYQVDNSLSKLNEGSGLGLYIVNSLVNIIGASIKIDSVVNIGTTITVTLPIIKDTRDDNTLPIINEELQSRVNIELSDLK